MRRRIVGFILAGFLATLLAACATTGTSGSAPTPEPPVPRSSGY